MEGIATTTFRITGTRPLVMHSVRRFLDPFDKQGREKAKIGRKHASKKTDTDHMRLAFLEFLLSLYLDENGGVILPADNIQRMIRDGATETRNGKNITAGLTVMDDARLIDPTTNKQYADPDAMWEADNGKRHRFLSPVTMGTARVLRCRPIFHNWQATFTVSWIEEILSHEVVHRAVEWAGVVKGLCDYRPRYGSFTAEVVS